MKQPKPNQKNYGKIAVILSLCAANLLAFCHTSYAQLNPFGQMYFQNQYLVNPAVAGLTDGLKINMAYRQQWTSLPDAPNTQALTAQYGFNSNIGLGLHISNDMAGLLRRTKVLGTIAYHLPLGTNQQKLSLGLSAGVSDQSIDYDNGEEPVDNSVTRFNDRAMHFDGEAGLAFTSQGLTIQGSVANFKDVLQKYELKNLTNQPTFFTAISYKTKINLSGDVNPLGIEPKFCYRGVKGFKSILDVGANLTMLQEKLQFTAIYHSTGSTTLGAGTTFKSLGLIAMYSTKATGLREYNNQNFEVGLQYSLTKKP